MMANPIISRLSFLSSPLIHSTTFSIILALSITDSKIGMAFARTPSETLQSHAYFDDYGFYSTTPSSSTENTVHTLDPIHYMPSHKDILPRTNRKRETTRVAQELQSVCSDIRASAFLVTWPLSPMSGKPGRECGKVLHVLDAMTERETPIITKNKPCMLWDLNREERISVVCTKHEQKTMFNPLKSWLLTEKILRKNLKLQKQNEELSLTKTAIKNNSRYVSEMAHTALQEFIDLNWPVCSAQGTPQQPNDAEEILVRNQLLNGSFLHMEDPQETQMRLLI